MVLGLILLVAVVLLIAFLVSVARNEVRSAMDAASLPVSAPRSPVLAPAASARPRSSYRVPAQLVSVQERQRGLLIDALLLEAVDDDGRTTPSGTPVTFKVVLPADPVLRQSVVVTIAGWAEGIEVVDLDILPGRRMDIVHAGSSVRLDVEGAVGIP